MYTYENPGEVKPWQMLNRTSPAANPMEYVFTSINSLEAGKQPQTANMDDNTVDKMISLSPSQTIAPVPFTQKITIGWINEVTRNLVTDNGSSNFHWNILLSHQVSSLDYIEGPVLYKSYMK